MRGHSFFWKRDDFGSHEGMVFLDSRCGASERLEKNVRPHGSDTSFVGDVEQTISPFKLGRFFDERRNCVPHTQPFFLRSLGGTANDSAWDRRDEKPVAIKPLKASGSGQKRARTPDARVEPGTGRPQSSARNFPVVFPSMVGSHNS